MHDTRSRNVSHAMQAVMKQAPAWESFLALVSQGAPAHVVMEDCRRCGERLSSVTSHLSAYYKAQELE
jgi:predicted pyridoxine 5'-phosphate oxidase superfamily flavin-nucleotide-binding protein